MVLGAFCCLAGLLIGEPMLISSIPPASMACTFGSPTSMESPWGLPHPPRLAPANGLR